MRETMIDDDMNVRVTGDDGYVDQDVLLARILAELRILRTCTPRLDSDQIELLAAALVELEPAIIWADALGHFGPDDEHESIGASVAALRARGLIMDKPFTRPGPDGRQQIARSAAGESTAQRDR
jgi:hypothetical protein